MQLCLSVSDNHNGLLYAREIYLQEGDGYDAWVGSLRPEVMEDYNAVRNHWDGKRVKAIDDAQRWIFDLFLKSNKVTEGARDYAGVIGIIMTMEREEYMGEEDD